MSKYTNPLDKIRIASPCAANWNEMVGDDRQRHCSECKLNVYNLSEMTQSEAENFLINAEGRVCLQVFRRKDGTVLTKDCPVGWQKIKRKVSRAATAVFALVGGLFGGVFAYLQLSPGDEDLLRNENLSEKVVVREDVSEVQIFEIEAPRPVINKKIKPMKLEEMPLGRVENLEELKTTIMIKRIR